MTAENVLIRIVDRRQSYYARAAQDRWLQGDDWQKRYERGLRVKAHAIAGPQAPCKVVPMRKRRA